MNQIVFLGTGTSTGVPEIGCTCEVCASTDPRDKRLRNAALIRIDGREILIDCGPDFRQQMLRTPSKHLAGVLLTHEHYDHTGGLDDLRPYCYHGNVNIYAEQRVCQAIRTRMPYCFGDHLYPGVPKLLLHEISTLPFEIEGIAIQPIRLMHGKMPIIGYRIGRLAYLTDVSEIPESAFSKLRDLDLLALDALRIQPHIAHFSLTEALLAATRIGARRTYLMHIAHNFGLHAAMEPTLPTGVHIAYDGLVVNVQATAGASTRCHTL